MRNAEFRSPSRSRSVATSTIYWSLFSCPRPPSRRLEIEAYEREVKVDATVCRTSDPGEDLRSFTRCPFTQTRSPAMNFIGVDLHKKSITVCVMDEKRKVLARKTLALRPTRF